MYSINKYHRNKKMKIIRLLPLIVFVFSVINSTAQNINKPNKMGPMGTQVNTQTGNLYISRGDIYVPARGFDISVSFNYNSFNFERNSGFGNGWSLGYSIKYKNDTASSKTISWGDGREDNYTALSGGGFQSPKGFFNTLTQYQPDKYLLTESDGSKYYFDNSTHKRITRIEEPNGNYINFNYTDTLLTSLVNTAGQSISFTYNGAGNLATVVDAIVAPTRTYTYAYDGNKNLITVTDPLGGTNKYSYLINGHMKTMTDKNNNTVDIIYFNNFSISEIIGCNKRVSFSYDTATNMTIATDHLATGSNQVTKYGYKKIGDQVWLTSISGNCCGFNMSFEFDDKGNKIKETDANGNAYNYTYDARGNMLTMKDPLNQTSAYTYSANYNQVTSFTDPKGNVYAMTYDGNGNLTQLTEPGNITYTAAYNANGDMITSTDAKGHTYAYSYDANGNPTSVSGPNGYQVTLANDARGNVLSFTDAGNNTHTAEYDILNRLKKIIDPVSNNIRLNYDTEGNTTAFINENNEPTQIAYDASNRIVQFNDVMGKKTTVAYDAMDNLTAITNTLGNTVKLSYNSKNKLTGLVDPQGNNLNINYDANGNITSVNMPNGKVFNYTYDQLNRLISVTDISGTIENYTYDKNNNVTGYTNGTGAIMTAEYDNLNRLKKTTDPIGNSVAMTYDNNNNVISVTDRNGLTSNYTYDSLNRPKTATDNNGFIVTAGYDAQGNVMSIKDQNNNVTNYTYDNLNRITRTTYPDSKFTQYTYNNKGNIVSNRLTDGTTINYIYDSLNRIVSKTLPDGHVYSYTYDALGRVLSATNNAGTVTISYDVLNRVISESYNGRTVNYSYNIAGRTQTIVYPDSTIITNSFDTRSRLISMAKNNSVLVTYQYNNENQIVAKNFANGVSTNQQYDFANRLSNFSTAGGAIQNTNLAYNNEQKKTAINRINAPAKSEQFTYDNGHRLTNYKRGVIDGTPTIQNTYSYDAAGNRTTANLNGVNTTYTSNTINQLTNSNNGTQNINFIYDNNGNLTYDGLFYKTYDAEKRLLKDSSAPANVLSYQYDAFGRRVQRNMNGQVLNYTFSGIKQIEERDSVTGLIMNKTIFSNFLTPVVNEKNNSLFYYHQNELNSVEAITNQQGRLIEKYDYDVYGKMSIYDSLNNPLSGSLAGNRFGFTGQVYDSATGNYKFFFREYNPRTGLFNQQDLINYADGMGMYQYVHNNPANGIDIFGLEDCPPGENGNAQSEKKKDLFDHLSKLSNWLSIINEGIKTTSIASLTVATRLAGSEETLHDLAKFDNKFGADLAKNKKFAKLSSAAQIIPLINKINKLKNDYDNMTSKDVQVEVADIEMALLGIANDKGAFKAIPGFGRIVGAVGAIDALSQEATGHSLSYHYAHLSDGAEKIGKDLAKNMSSNQRRFNKHEEFLQHIKKKHGNDRSKWLQEWLDIEDLHNKAADVGFVYTGNKKIDCPPNGNPGGTQKPNPKGPSSGTLDSSQAVGPKDPNAIIGPDGQPTNHWVSVKDRLPYTILYENDKTASAPAKFVRVTSPIEPKQDAATFQLGNFGFNNQFFTVPPNTASYYQRLDCRDSLELYVDITAGYDQINNLAFWEFQSIDPITLLPPSDPLKGFLLLQDSTKALYGHGFVNFSIKPIQTAITLDTIGARASIVFDFNDTIPTNIAMNTIDAFAPTSHMNALPANSNNPITLSWTGIDDTGGCGIDFYTIYVSVDHINYSVLIPKISRNDTSLTLPPDSNYCFFVLATDRVGNIEILRPAEIQCSFVGAPLPVTWLYFRGKTVVKNNILDWATTNEQNSKKFDVERSLNGTSFSRIGYVNAAGNSNQTNTYQYTDYDIDRLNSTIMYYRLKQIDIDGKFKYSQIVRLNYKEKNVVNSIVYPNPTKGSVTILVGDQALVGSVAALYDINGRLLENIKIATNSQTVNLGNYLNGFYFIKLINKEVLKVIKN